VSALAFVDELGIFVVNYFVLFSINPGQLHAFYLKVPEAAAPSFQAHYDRTLS